MLKAIQAFLTKEIREENEPKDTAVLIRALCLVDFLFIGINAVVLLADFGIEIGARAFAGLLFIVLVFALSYRVKMRALVFLYYFAVITNAVMLTTHMGLPYMFQAQIYIIFMIFFYRAAGSQTERIASVVSSVIIIFGLIFYVRTHGPVLNIAMADYGFVTFYCTAYIMVKTVMLAFFFRKKFSASEEKIIKYSKKLEMLATTDPLTKLQNRRGMINHIENFVEETKSNGKLLTVAIGDIDLFKHINDTYGHEAGDYVLETIAKIMKEFIEGKGMVARWGGEEFLFSLEDINGDYAFEEISKLLHLIERYEFLYEGTPIKVTMTFGLEEYDDNTGLDKVISKADEKLYIGKKQGRNRVIY